MKYRADIDGLRAVAVLPVVLYHLQVAKVPGGFVGVDVFFIISGFLIAGILADEMAAGRYSILTFYERRARRIFPALFVVLAATVVVSWYISLPFDIYELGQSVVATLFFISNFLYYFRSGYFDTRSGDNPLLHTWSLAVEEQFYVLFPLLLWLATKYFPRQRLYLFSGLGLASFIYSVVLVNSGGDGSQIAFYMSTARAWELALGALLAMGAPPPPNSRILREGLAITGLALLVYAFLRFSADTPFPGAAALVPCIGAALVIYTGQADTITSRLLSMRIIVWFGLISYSLYLWHLPAAVFFRQEYGEPLSLADKGLLLIGSIGLAYLSWRYVEQPFRLKARFDRKQIFAYSAGALAGLSMIGADLVLTDGSAWRFSPNLVQASKALGYKPGEPMRLGKCFIDLRATPVLDEQCLVIDASKTNYLLFGDSHAAHLWVGLTKEFPEINFLQATASGCAPVLGVKGSARCTYVKDKVFSDFLPHHKVDALLISARWNMSELDPLIETIRAMKAYVPRIVVLGPIVEYRKPLPQLLAASLRNHDQRGVSEAREYKRIAAIDANFRQRLEKEGATYISMFGTLCGESDCTVTDEAGFPIQFDYGHLTEGGAVLVAKRWRTQHLMPLQGAAGPS